MGLVNIDIPAGCITNGMLVGSIGADKMAAATRCVDYELYADASAVVAVTRRLHACRAAGTVVGFEAVIALDATGADRVVSVDLQLAHAGGSFSTILSAPISIPDGSTINTPYAGTISAAALIDGDVLQVVVTVAGAAGNAAKGLLVTLTYDEARS